MMTIKEFRLTIIVTINSFQGANLNRSMYGTKKVSTYMTANMICTTQ